MLHRWGRLSCACHRCLRLNMLPLPLSSARSPAHRCARCAAPRFTPPLLRRSNRHHNKNKIIKHCVSIALLFVITLTPPPPRLDRRSSGGTESQSRAAGGAMERGSGRSGRSDGEGERAEERLIFGRMLLKQTPVCCNSLQFADNPRVLEITIRHPDFDNTEILLR
jgi:hypothetical protein